MGHGDENRKRKRVGEEGAGADSNGMKDLRALGASLGSSLADIVLSARGGESEDR